MASFHFDLVAPDKLLFSGEVDQVDLPGAEGDFGVLVDHAPMVVLLRPGVISVIVGGQAERIVIFGGFAEISPQGLTVLADNASSVQDLDPAVLAQRVAETEDKIKKLEPGSVLDREVERLDQLKTISAQLETATRH
jgi:F-type H+-transporting ATPase subunit epsilon